MHTHKLQALGTGYIEDVLLGPGGPCLSSLPYQLGLECVFSALFVGPLI